MGINKAILLGNLGRDPELRYTSQQFPICNLNIATTERKKDASGNMVEHTEWHKVVVLGKQAENCSAYLSKGHKAYVEGRIQTRKWQDRDGKDRYTTEILAYNVQFLGTRDVGAKSAGEPDSRISASGILGTLPTADEIAAANESTSVEDDQIPF